MLRQTSALHGSLPRGLCSSCPSAVKSRCCKPVLGGRITSAVRKSQLQVRAAESLYDRKYEVEGLTSTLEKTPRAATLIVGPQNVGKSVILRATLEGLSGSVLKVFLDGRGVQLTSSAALVDALETAISNSLVALPDNVRKDMLHELGKSVTARIEDTSEETGEDTGVPAAASFQVVFPSNKAGTVADMVKILQAMIELAVRKGIRAVIAVDEATRFRNWVQDDDSSLRVLMDFFARVSKQENLAHIILATSDYNFYIWLQKYISVRNIDEVVIGDFPEADARGFLQEYLLPQSGLPASALEVTDDIWRVIYKVCGGNAGALGRFAVKYMGDVDEALEGICDPVLALLEGALAEEVLWTPAQCRAVFRAIVTSPHRAVPEKKMLSLLGKDGRKVLLNLVEGNLVGLRPKSSMARDISPAAFETSRKVVTPMTPVDYYAMTLLESEGVLKQRRPRSKKESNG